MLAWILAISSLMPRNMFFLGGHFLLSCERLRCRKDFCKKNLWLLDRDGTLYCRVERLPESCRAWNTNLTTPAYPTRKFLHNSVNFFLTLKLARKGRTWTVSMLQYHTYIHACTGAREHTAVTVYTNNYVYISIHMPKCGSTKAIPGV